MFIEDIQEGFASRYTGDPTLVRAPGRINLIGEHTDYNGGFVLPAAIDKEIHFAIVKTQEDHCRVYAHDVQEEISFDPAGFQKSKKEWANYVLGVIDQIQKLGHTIGPFDCLFGGDIPAGAGMSSSAALECGIATALNTVFNLGLSPLTIAQLSQRAENEYVGANCGIMDQFASMFGKEHHALKLDCRSLEYQYYPIDLEGYKLILINSEVKHELVSSGYNDRRQEAEAGVARLQQLGEDITSLRDVSMDTLRQHEDQLDPVIYLRCMYVIQENQRVLEACRALEEGDTLAFGQRMYESHRGLSTQYEVSCPELDFLVAQTRLHEGVRGARMMGGGFGGCTLNLVKNESLGEVITEIPETYQKEFGIDPEVYLVELVDGAGVINL